MSFFSTMVEETAAMRDNIAAARAEQEALAAAANATVTAMQGVASAAAEVGPELGLPPIDFNAEGRFGTGMAEGGGGSFSSSSGNSGGSGGGGGAPRRRRLAIDNGAGVNVVFPNSPGGGSDKMTVSRGEAEIARRQDQTNKLLEEIARASQTGARGNTVGKVNR